MLNAYTHPKEMKKEDAKGWLYTALYFAAMAAVATAANFYF